MSRYLDTVDQPKDVKKLTLEQLRHLAEEIRQELITVLSKNGGHLGPNLAALRLQHSAG
jgi:1-deoxy-D-xylulose-5-phosphate synthase